jgi:hypothetical protein
MTAYASQPSSLRKNYARAGHVLSLNGVTSEDRVGKTTAPV